MREIVPVHGAPRQNQRRRVTLELAGVPEAQELEQLRVAVPSYDPGGVSLLLDLRGRNATEVSADTARSLAAFLSSLQPGVDRVGVLASVQPLYFSSARLIQSYLETAGIQVASFFKSDDAVTWLEH